MELTWFRQPGPTPGTLNLCFNAVDLHVVRGEATAPAVRTAAGPVDFATLLEDVAALAGAMRSLGVEEGSVVGCRADGLDRLLVLLACLRLGAAYVDGEGAGLDPHLVAEPDAVQPAVRAGRADPAPCADLPPDTTAYLDGGAAVPLVALPAHPSWAGTACATLCAGQTLDLTGGPA